jgi:hypothetical protein
VKCGGGCGRNRARRDRRLIRRRKGRGKGRGAVCHFSANRGSWRGCAVAKRASDEPLEAASNVGVREPPQNLLFTTPCERCRLTPCAALETRSGSY